MTNLTRFAALLAFAAPILAPGRAAAQIGAEAQGGKLTTWVAFGLDKELSEHWTSVTDIGFGRHSDPTGDLNPVKRQGLFVVTQDFIYRISPHWRTAVSFGYWRRNSYQEEAPYEASQPNTYRNELRPFQKLYYDVQFGKILFTNTLRADYRFYFTPGFSRWPTPFELRAREMVNAKIPLDPTHRHWIILNDEVLTAADDYSAGTAEKMGHQWSPYKLTENRASVYYRHSFPEHKLDCDIGIMHQRWRETQQPAFNTSYNLMMDFIFK
ncbi:MAG: DUF2490 domain-containing protein [Bacteroidota bacterium]|nr:DUF2490 domain-containing protein [Bacteroidota bacterium]